MKKLNTFYSFLLLSLTILAISCQNGRVRGRSGIGPSIGTKNSTNNINATIITLDPSTSAPSKATVRFDTDPLKTPRPINQLCSVGAANQPSLKPCVCRFERTVVNANGGRALSYQKVDRTSVDEIRNAYEVSCPMPSDYPTQFPSGTVFRVKIESGPGNPENILTNQFKKRHGSQSNGQADFTISDGTKFRDIFEYSCYEKEIVDQALENKVLEVTRALSSESNPQGERKNIPLATQFCSTRGGKGTWECKVSEVKEFSSMSFYYRFYVQNRQGILRTEGGRYTCPLVNRGEGLPDRGSFGGGANVFPLAKRMSLAMNWTPEFPVGIEGAGSLYDPGNAGTHPKPCKAINGTDRTSSGTPSADSITYQCQGYAARPKPDKACGYVRDAANGKIRPMTRLRKYVTLFPAHADATGRILDNGARGIEATLYVPDRIVDNPNNDPLDYYTMLGPKPCPAAWFDRKGALKAPYHASSANRLAHRQNGGIRVKQHFIQPYHNGPQAESSYLFKAGAGRPIYRAPGGSATAIDPFFTDPRISDEARVRSHYNWDNRNVDFLIFPNFDSQEKNSCAATLPYVEYSNDLSINSVTLLTSSHDAHDFRSASPTDTLNVPWVQVSPLDKDDKRIRLDEVFLRPLEANRWTHWVEDTNFEACVPAPSTGIKDPPLHVVKLPNGNVSYCSAEYPTQMPYIQEFDKFSDGTTFSGMFKNFTSPVKKNQLIGGSNCRTNPLGNSITGYPGFTNYRGNSNNSNLSYIGFARHPSGIRVDYDGTRIFGASETCDRTVSRTNNAGLKGFPLQADPDDIETILWKDPSYQCLITYDKDGGKAWKNTPSGGCCGYTQDNREILHPNLRSGGTGPSQSDIDNRKKWPALARAKAFTATAQPDNNGNICGKIPY